MSPSVDRLELAVAVSELAGILDRHGKRVEAVRLRGAVEPLTVHRVGWKAPHSDVARGPRERLMAGLGVARGLQGVIVDRPRLEHVMRKIESALA